MVQVRVQGIEGSADGVKEVGQIQKTYEFALDRFVHTVREVEVWCADINGPRGGLDKTCRVQLRLYPRGVLTAKSSGTSFIHAARDACDKVKTLLLRKLSKRKSHQRTQFQGDLK